MKRIALITLIVALLATGCGKDKKDVEAQGDSPVVTAPVTPEEAIKQAEAATGTSLTIPPAVKSSGPGSTTTTTAKSGGQAGATTTAPTADPSVTMKLDRACVRRGPNGDKQGFSATTQPDSYVAWSTQYSDGSNEMSNQEYKTGSGYAKSDSAGNFHTEWIVPIQAPLGEAQLHTIAKGKLQPPLKFRVVGENESC